MYAVDQHISSRNERSLEERKSVLSPVTIDFSIPQDMLKERALRIRVNSVELNRAALLSDLVLLQRRRYTYPSAYKLFRVRRRAFVPMSLHLYIKLAVSKNNCRHYSRLIQGLYKYY
jgi:hypothetical protein